MSRRLLLLLAPVIAGVLGIGVALFSQPKSTLPEAPPGGDFVLDSADGPLDTATLRGKLVLIYFGYTYCPDICPTSLAATSQALNSLTPSELAQVKTVFVSVDPERDTPARLKDYVAFFHPTIVGVTGSPKAVAAAAKKYGAVYARQDIASTASYVVDHSAWTYIVTPDGRLVDRIAHGAAPEQIAAQIHQWLLSPSTPKGST